MTLYSVQPNGRIFVKGYGFLTFEIWEKSIGEDIIKNFTGKYV